MVRRYAPPMNGERYMGDVRELVVHELDNEKAQCQVDGILAAGHARPFNSLAAAHAAGFMDCPLCMGRAARHQGDSRARSVLPQPPRRQTSGTS